MKINRIWIVECAYKGKQDWEPLTGRCFSTKHEAKINISDCASLLDIYDYRVRCYVLREK